MGRDDVLDRVRIGMTIYFSTICTRDEAQLQATVRQAHDLARLMFGPGPPAPSVRTSWLAHPAREPAADIESSIAKTRLSSTPSRKYVASGKRSVEGVARGSVLYLSC